MLCIYDIIGMDFIYFLLVYSSDPVVTPSEKFGQSVAIPGDSMVESGSDCPELPGTAKWDFLTSGGD